MRILPSCIHISATVWLKHLEKARCQIHKDAEQHPTKKLYSHLPPITQTIQVRKNTWHCWRSKNKHITNVLLKTSTYGHTRVGRPAKTD